LEIHTGASGPDLDDFIQQARFFTCQLAMIYDPFKGARFSTFAQRLLPQMLKHWRMTSLNAFEKKTEYEYRALRKVQIFRTENGIAGRQPLTEDELRHFAMLIGKKTATARKYDASWIHHGNVVSGSFSLDDDAIIGGNEDGGNKMARHESPGTEELQSLSAEQDFFTNHELSKGHAFVEEMFKRSTSIERIIIDNLMKYPKEEAIAISVRMISEKQGKPFDRKSVIRLIKHSIKVNAYAAMSEQVLNPGSAESEEDYLDETVIDLIDEYTIKNRNLADKNSNYILLNKGYRKEQEIEAFQRSKNIV
jgi:hypothetical protein